MQKGAKNSRPFLWRNRETLNTEDAEDTEERQERKKRTFGKLKLATGGHFGTGRALNSHMLSSFLVFLRVLRVLRVERIC
jgi:hypothetical protein